MSKKGVDKQVWEKLDEAIEAAERGDWQEAFEDLSHARFLLFDEEDIYREPLVDKFDSAMELAWRQWRRSEQKGKPVKNEEAKRRLEKIVDSIRTLIENPRGEKANPPKAPQSPRDARLWDMAKYIVKDEYPEVEEGSERFWELVSGIFRRMKLRLGGLERKKVEEIVERLREKHGKLPQAGEGAKALKEIERLKEKIRESLRKAIADAIRELLASKQSE